MSNYFDTYFSLRSPLHNPHYLPPRARVLLRADLNVPLVEQTIADDFRLRALVPTLDALLTRKATIRLITHIGKPTGHDPALSTKPIATWLQQQGYPVSTSTSSPGTIVVEENVRFDPREQEGDLDYAHRLSLDSDYYINDAFGSAHRNDTSLTLLAEQFPHSQRGIGLLMQQELQTLGNLHVQPRKPIIMVLGGGKINKLTHAASLINNFADTLLLCPILGPIVASFPIHEVQHALQQLRHNPKVLVPLDYLVSSKFPWKPPFHIIPAQELTDLHLTVSAGPETIAAWRPILEQAGAIIFNGPMGTVSIPETTTYLQELLHIITESNAYSVVGGGDSLQVLDTYNLTSKISYCSTGGGSMLAYLAGEKLPALEAVKN